MLRITEDTDIELDLEFKLTLRFFVLQPDTVTGDIVFVLQQKEHPKFKRKAEDLFVEHTLSLTEALCGFQFVLTHLDGRQLLIKSNPGEVVKPGMLNYSYLVFSLSKFSLLIVTSMFLTFNLLSLAYRFIQSNK